MKILVTGGCGYVGTQLVGMLLEKTNHEVVVIDTQWFGNYLKPNPRLVVHKFDTRNIDEFSLQGFDVVYHLANIANDPAVELNKYLSWEVNVLATMRLLNKAARSGVKHFINASSSSVYGVKEEDKVTEDLELLPISEYNKTKMVAERVVDSYIDVMKTTNIRPATVCGYSPRMRFDVSVNMLTMQALRKKEITVFGGDQVRPNIHIEDLNRVYLHVLDKGLTGTYNAGFENISIMKIAEMVKEVIPETKISVTPSNDPRSYRVCSDKLTATGFAPKRGVKDAIQEIVRLYQNKELDDQPNFHTVKWMKDLGVV